MSQSIKYVFAVNQSICILNVVEVSFLSYPHSSLRRKEYLPATEYEVNIFICSVLFSSFFIPF